MNVTNNDHHNSFYHFILWANLTSKWLFFSLFVLLRLSMSNQSNRTENTFPHQYYPSAKLFAFWKYFSNWFQITIHLYSVLLCKGWKQFQTFHVSHSISFVFVSVSKFHRQVTTLNVFEFSIAHWFIFHFISHVNSTMFTVYFD